MGLVLGGSSLFDIMGLAILTWIAGLVFVVALIVHLLSKVKPTAVTVFTALLFLFGSTTLIVSIHTQRNISLQKQALATQILTKLEAHKKQQGHYPESLSLLPGIQSDDSNTFWYTTDSLKQAFSLSYSIDGWHKTKIDSDQGQWISGD